MAYGPGGELFVVDWFNHRIQKFDPDGAFVKAFGDYGTGATSGNLIFPRGIMVRRRRARGDRLREQPASPCFDLDGTFLGSFKPLTGAVRSTGPTRPPWRPDGTYWVADTNNDRIVHLDGAGAVLHTWDNRGTIKSPQGIAVDGDGNVYVSNTNQNRIEKYSPDGTPPGHRGAGPARPTARSTDPQACSSPGPGADARLWVADAGTNNRVQVLRARRHPRDDLRLHRRGDEQFSTPKAVAVSPVDERIAVADFGNDRVSVWSRS